MSEVIDTSAETVGARQRRDRRRGARYRHLFAVVSVAPAVILSVLFLFVPMALVIWLSFTQWSGLGPLFSGFVGIENYRRLLSPEFYSAIRVTFLYTVIGGFATVAVGFVLAALIHSRLRGWRFYRVAWFIPVLLPGAVTALLWVSGVFASNVGAADSAARQLGFSPPTLGWLGDPNYALAAALITTIWAATGFPMLILSAAMERIPPQIYEAARLDGAGGMRIVWDVTLPLVRPVLATVSALQLIGMLKGFDLLFVMTGGGPGGKTTTLALLLYTWGFGAGRFGMASAVAVLMLLLIVPVAILARGWVSSD